MSAKRGLNYGLNRAFARFKKAKARPDVKRVLLIRRNKLGDMINLLPVIQALKESHPAIEIYLLCNPYNAGPARHVSYLSGVFDVPEKYVLGRVGSLLHPTYRAIRALNIDLSIAFGGHSTQAAMMSLACGAKYKVGLASESGTVFDVIYDHGIDMPSDVDLRGCEHQVQKCAYIVRAAGFELAEPLPDVRMDRPGMAEPGVVGLCPDSARAACRYPVESYRRLAARLREYPWVSEVRVFPSADTSYAELLREPSLNVIPPTSFQQWLKNLSSCEYAICAEGGSMHMTSALGIPTLALSGRGIRDGWTPWARNAVMLEKHREIAHISVDEIIGQLISFRENGSFKSTPHANFCQKYR
jgi:ADP-heptose:LPS heptosyltransferase